MSSTKSKAEWSAAAKKVIVNNSLKVSVTKSDLNSDGNKSKDNNPKSGNYSLSLVNGSVSPEWAFCFMEAWGRVFDNAPGTKDYVAKANQLSAARAKAYASLGIQPAKGVRPELTEEQRLAYSELVRPYSFDYYEVRLSFKQPGKKAVRSKTYRYLDAPDLLIIRDRLFKNANTVKSQYSIKKLATN
jgi:hypothetical protein